MPENDRGRGDPRNILGVIAGPILRIFTARAMLALQALYKLQQFRPSVCLPVCLSVTRPYCVKTTARSTVQFAPLDSKMCLVL